MIRIECLGCGKVQEVEIKPGRPRLYCNNACRLASYRKVRENPELQKEIQKKKKEILKQYREARDSTMSVAGLRKRAMVTLHNNGWSFENIGKIFSLTDERVRQIIGE